MTKDTFCLSLLHLKKIIKKESKQIIQKHQCSTLNFIINQIGWWHAEVSDGIFGCQTKVYVPKPAVWSVNIWLEGPNSYSSKISGKCTRTDQNAIWRHFALIRRTWLCCLLRQFIEIQLRMSKHLVSLCASPSHSCTCLNF